MRDAQKEWNEIAAEYDDKIIRGDFFREKVLDVSLRKHIGSVNNKLILDLGCGQGYLSKALTSDGATTVGIDASTALIEIANKRYKGTNTSFVVGNIEKQFPFQDNYFDIVVSNMVLMDIENPKQTMQEVVRTTKEGGLFVFSILHPLFTGGNIHKPIKDFVLHRRPSFLLRDYKKQKQTSWNILGTTKITTVFHRPMEYYLSLLIEQNISISKIEELTLPEIHNESGFNRMLQEIPIFLVLGGIINK